MIRKIKRWADRLFVIRFFLRSGPMRPVPRMTRSGKCLSLQLALSLLLTGFATIAGESWEEVTFVDNHNAVAVAPRERNATLTAETPEHLKSHGYIELGRLRVTYTTERCFGKNCDTKSHSEVPTERLLREAAKHGGDVVILSQDNRSGVNTLTKQGRCIRNESVRVPAVPYLKCKYETVTDRYGNATTRQTSTCTTEYRPGYELRCVEYDVRYGSESVVESVGTVWRYDPDLAKQVAERGKPLQLADEFFLLAVAQGDLQVVQDALARGLNPNATDAEGHPLLVVATQNGQLDVIELLIERGAKVNAGDEVGLTALHEATRGGQTAIVEALLAKGADVNAKSGNGDTALMIAARWNGQLDTVEALLTGGANVDAKDNDGWTALMTAAFFRQETVKLLLTHGADVNARNRHGETALMVAVYRSNAEAARLLLTHGADVNAKDERGKTALMGAALRDDTAVVNLLKQAGAKE